MRPAASPTQIMTRVLQLAEKGRDHVSPNPMVGCVILKDDVVVGEGYHEKLGGPHAEVYALRQAGAAASGATVFINLEPCCHQGRTPPCTEALIRAGVKKVVVASADPNPLVAGKGLAKLKAAGIEVEVGLCAVDAQRLNKIFFHYMTHKRPFVMAKWAMSLDGKTITHPQDDRNISSSTTQQSAHGLRQVADAILVGSNTALKDDPSLTVRSPDILDAKHPVRIVVSGRASLPINLKLFSGNLPGQTILATTHASDKTFVKQLQNKNIEIIYLPKNANGQVCLSTLLHQLAEREIASLLVEGGRTIQTSFFNQHLVDEVHVFLAPTIIAALNKKNTLSSMHFSQMGNDFYFSGQLTRNEHV